MRMTLLTPRAARSLTQSFHQRQPRRSFATPPSKSPSPPEPLDPSNEQAMPLGPYYESIIQEPQPIPEAKPEEPPTSTTDDADAPDAPSPASKAPRGRKPKDDKSKTAAASTPPIPTPSTSTPPSAPAQARVVFSAPLLGPAERAERLAAIRSRSRLIAGVMVPPKPDEPDNCCMSGCVNCVWDRYRDEMEEWASASAEADRRLRAQEAGVGTTAAAESVTSHTGRSMRGPDLGTAAATSMDDDGGGSVGNWDVGNMAGQGAGGTLTKDFWDDDLYKNVPVGIREFMKQEKRLKEKHMREGTFGG